MKKKNIIPIVAVIIVLLIGTLCFLIFNKSEKVASIITLDINPSIELKLNDDKKVISVNALNEDAKELITGDIKGEDIEEALGILVDNIKKSKFINDDSSVSVVLYSENIEIEPVVSRIFADKDVRASLIVIDKITDEDKELAEKYNVSPAKIAYIKDVIKENPNIDMESIVDSPIQSIEETKVTGKTCPKDYYLEGDWCYKETNRTKAKDGQVCPEFYREYNGKCYYEGEVIEKDEYVCHDDETLNGDKCIINRELTPRYDDYKCDKGTKVSCAKINGEAENSNNNCYKCVDESRVEKPTYICVVKQNGNCYGGQGKPHIDGKCINGDIEYNGKCYEKRQYEYVCKNGKIVNSKDSYCPGDPAVTDAIPVYYCNPEDGELVGNHCVKKEERNAERKRECSNGTTLVEDRMCLDLNKTTEKTNGLVCEGENTRQINNECITYEIIESK